jgi:hypothetical protein
MAILCRAAKNSLRGTAPYSFVSYIVPGTIVPSMPVPPRSTEYDSALHACSSTE